MCRKLKKKKNLNEQNKTIQKNQYIKVNKIKCVIIL